MGHIAYPKYAIIYKKVQRSMNSLPNAHMNHKSAIQLVSEVLVARESFFNELETLNETYSIQDTVFCCDEYGRCHELTEGYYGEVAEYETLDEAKQNINILMQGVRVHEGKFAVGNLYRNLVDVKESVIIDLAKSTIL